MMQTKVGHVVFEHDEQFRGEVVIARGEARISVPIDALRKIVAESIRQELADHILRMKPELLLRRIA